MDDFSRFDIQPEDEPERLLLQTAVEEEIIKPTQQTSLYEGVSRVYSKVACGDSLIVAGILQLRCNCGSFHGYVLREHMKFLRNLANAELSPVPEGWRQIELMHTPLVRGLGFHLAPVLWAFQHDDELGKSALVPVKILPMVRESDAEKIDSIAYDVIQGVSARIKKLASDGDLIELLLGKPDPELVN